VGERVAAVERAIAAGEPRTVVEIVPDVYGEPINAMTAAWRLSETLSYLTHLERQGEARRIEGEPERWEAAR